MRYVEVGGLRMSVIGLGTWQFGSREWGYGDAYARDTAPAILRRALDLGVTLIDTAEMYGFGRSERIVGGAIAGRRDGLVVATKLVPFLPLPAVVDRQVHGSLRRLRVDAIDLYQVHFPNPLVSPRATVAPLRHLLDQGLVCQIGVSNHSLERWQAAERGLGRLILTNQVRFSLAAPLPRWQLVPYARETGRVVIAYSPLGQGLLSGRYGVGRRPTGWYRRRAPLFGDATLRRAQPLVDTVTDIARAHGATPAQVALAWLVAHGNVVAIPGASSIGQMEENAAAADLDLDAAEIERLSEEATRFALSRRA